MNSNIASLFFKVKKTKTEKLIPNV
jgi:hypothetical protein